MRVFRSKRADRIKVVVWDGSDLVLVWKQLEAGEFRWPPVVDGAVRLTPVEFAALFAGIDWTRVQSAALGQDHGQIYAEACLNRFRFLPALDGIAANEAHESPMWTIAESYHIVGIGCMARHLHAGRAKRHLRHCQAAHPCRKFG